MRQGRLFNGDELLYVMVADRLAQAQRRARRGRHADDQHGGRAGAAARAASTLVRAKVGDRYVLEELAARGWQLGGEGSGHLLALDRHTTGDGIVSALQMLQAVRRSGRTLAAAAGRRDAVPADADQRAPAPTGSDWKQQRRAGDAQRAASSANSATPGRVLIRASGTEPVLRVMVEARDAALAQALRRAHGGSGAARLSASLA